MDKMEKLFNDLESLNPEESDRAKKEIADFFTSTKESWIVNGMIDYYAHTNSIRVFEVLVKVQTPHDIHIFNKLQKYLQEPNQLQKKTAICLFGHIVRRPPTWLHKIVNHSFHKELLKMLKIEQDVMILMSGLYCLISLLPIIPQSIMTFLSDLFEIFNHLARMTYHPSNIKECELIHLQYGYYMLFGRLYGMYPCNFIEFLRNEYVNKPENFTIFNHTIRPLLETVKIHPNLVTSTRQLEMNNTRFKKMEPHDVVVECAKYTIEVDRPPPTSSLDYPIYRSPLKPLEYTHLSTELPPLPEPPAYMSAKSVESKIESLLRPSSVVLATPPPTGTVPNTPTPTPIPIQPNYSMKHPEHSSPPQLIEAAIEATPETTPMKPDGINQPFRPYPKPNSQTARRIFGSNLSNPSSPLRKEPQSSFQFTSNDETNLDITGNHKLMRMMSDRQHHQITEPMMISREDQEVNEINSHNTSNDENGAHEMMDYDETPSTDDDVEDDADTTPPLCDPRLYNGREYVRRVKRLRQYSQCIYSAGTSPASNTSYMPRARSSSRVKRSNSWPNLIVSDVIIDPSKSKELNGSQQHQKTASSSPSDEAISADSHFRKKDQNGNADKAKLQQNQNLFKEIRNDLKTKPLELVQKVSKGTSTVECWPGMSAYDNLFYDAFLSDDLKRKHSNGLTVTTTTTTTTTITDNSHAYPTTHNLTTSEMLDQYIQASLRKMKSNDHRDHLELLAIQLQFEKYRREIHAERNRRLLGKSRQIRGLEQSNETMSDQVARLSTEITNLNKKAAETRNFHDMQLQKCQNDIKILSMKCNEEMGKNRQLQREKDLLQKKFDDEQKLRRQLLQNNEEMTAKMFDLNNLLAASQEEAQRGKEHRQQLVKLQSEMIIFNDARVKCKQRMEELYSLKSRDEEAECMYERYSQEISDTRKKLELKTSQNESFRSKIGDLEQQLSKKESSIREHKILNQIMMRTYDEKFKALEDKYATQKSIIVKLDEHILELSKNQATVTSLESERTADPIGSPLSISYASSDGYSTSLRSMSDMRNIQPLIGENFEQQSVIYPSSSTNSQQHTLQRQQSIHDDIASVSSPTKKK